MADDKQPERQLPLFEGKEPRLQRLKFSGKVDKDAWVAVPHDGDSTVYVVARARLGTIAHEYDAEGMFRGEAITILDAYVGTDPEGAIGALYREQHNLEGDLRRERTGETNMDDALAENAAEAAANAAAAAAGGDGVTDLETKRKAKDAEAKTGPKAEPKKSTTPAKKKAPAKTPAKKTK